MKIPNKRELQQITINHSSSFDFDDFKRLSRKCTAVSYLFSVISTFLTSDNAINPSELSKKSFIKSIENNHDHH